MIRIKIILKNILSLVLFIFILASCGKNDSDSSAAFVKFFGDTGEDEGSDLVQLSDGSYLILGTTTREEGDLDMVLVKTDKYGNQEWFKYFGYGADDEGGSVRVCADGGYVLVGTTTDTISGETDILLIKTSAGTQGEVEWSKTIGEDGNQVAHCIQCLDDGYVLTGSTDENGDMDILVVRTDEYGNVENDASSWYVSGGYNALSGNGLEDEGRYVIESADGYGFIIVGNATPASSENGQEVIVVAMSSNGVGWSNVSFGSSGDDLGVSVIHVSGNEYLVVGTGVSGSKNTGMVQPIEVDNEVLTLTDTEPLQFLYNGSSLQLNGICQNPSGGFALAGSVLYSTGNWNMYVSMTDTDGQPLSDGVLQIGGTGNEYVSRIISTSDGGYALVGSTGIPEDDNRMIVLIKLNDEGSLSD